MTQTIIMFAAAVNLIGVSCLINANRFYLIFLCQFLPVTLAIGLSIFAFARVMGWPL